ncbi:MAG: hypothetical protein ABI321_09195 [Polyangia bacterium]
MRALLTTLILAATVSVPVAASASPQSYEGTGRVAISAGDRVKARDRALDEAFQRALETAIGALLGPDTIVRRATDLRLKIMPRARSYVTSYRVLDEGGLEPGFFSVHVAAEVAADRLVRELQTPVALQKAGPLAAVRVGLCVRDGEPPIALPRLEAALRMRLEGAQLVVVPAMCGGGEGLRATLFADVSQRDVAPVRGTSLVGRETELELELVDGSDKRGAKGRGAGYGATRELALDDAAMTALPDTLSTLDDALAALSPKAAQSGLVLVRIAGVRRYAQLKTVRAAIQRLPGVDSVSLRRFAPAGGSIELGVKTAQQSHAIFEALGRVAPTYSLQVREVDGAIVVDVPDAATSPTETP